MNRQEQIAAIVRAHHLAYLYMIGKDGLLEAAKRRYVRGDIELDEYERELDRIHEAFK